MNTLHPRISEKTFMLSQTRNTYVFNVPSDMNRAMVAVMVAKDYNVKVVKVQISVSKGKAKRYVRKGGRVNTGTTQNVKKAYVRLAEGNTIPIFAALTEEEKNESKGVIENAAPKRGLLSKKTKAPSSASAGVKVTRSQAKVGEK